MAARYTRRQLGDRADGRKLRSIPAAERLIPHMIRTRSDAQETYRERIEVTDTLNWLSSKQQDGCSELSLYHIAAAAYIRTAARCPWINRFVAGHRIYARSGIQLVLPVVIEDRVKKMKADFSESDTVLDVYYRLCECEDNLKAGSGMDFTSRLQDFVMLLPRFLTRFSVQAARITDYYGLLTGRALEKSTWHGSLFLYDNADWDMNANPLPLSNFGNISVSVCLGAVQESFEPDADGTLHCRKWLEMDITADRRIADKAQLNTAIKLWKHYISAPHELEKAPRRTQEDVN